MNNNSNQTEQKNTNYSSNMQYQDFNALQLRLDTQKLHKDIYNFLRGKSTIVVYVSEAAQYQETEIDIGKPLANEIGIQNILNFVISVLNSHTVQGNTKKDELYDILYYVNIHLAQQLTLNTKSWGIDKKNRRHIIGTIMVMAQLFLSRTIDNLERGSLTPLVQKESTIVQTENKKGFL